MKTPSFQSSFRDRLHKVASFSAAAVTVGIMVPAHVTDALAYTCNTNLSNIFPRYLTQTGYATAGEWAASTGIGERELLQTDLYGCQNDDTGNETHMSITFNGTGSTRKLAMKTGKVVSSANSWSYTSTDYSAGGHDTGDVVSLVQSIDLT